MPALSRTGAALLLIAGVALAFGEALLALVRHWSASPMYSHAFTVPFISAFVLWTRRDAFAAHAPRPARVAGTVVTAVALLLLVFGDLVAVRLLQQLAFLVALAGIALFLFGWSYLRIGAPALGYLLFMIPFWDAFTEPLHWPFQHNSARLGVALLRAAGLPAYRDGTIIALPNVTLEVARSCSGVNYLIAVLALAVPLGVVRLRSSWRRIVLVVSSLIVAALGNGLRVALIGWLAYYEIGSPLHGPFHVLHGLFVAGVGYIALFAGLHLLERREAAQASPSVAITPAVTRRWKPADACALAIVFWLFVIVGVTPGSAPVALAQPLDLIPDRFGAWLAFPAVAGAIDHGRVDPWSEADHRLTREYRRMDGASAVLEIRYFEVQRQQREVVNFLVTDLHRGATVRHIPLPGGRVLKANLVDSAERDETTLFWYEVGGSSEADRYVAKLRTVWSVIRAGRSDGAAVLIRARRSQSGISGLEDLAARVHQALSRHWPAGQLERQEPSSSR